MTIERPKAFIPKSELQVMIDESLRYEDVETGTVLVGRWEGQNLRIQKVILPGPGATRTGSSFSPDSSYAQVELDIHREKHSDDGWVGVHHQHPPSLPVPSRGDLRQAQDILNDQDCNVGNRFVSVISIRQGADVYFLPYFLSQDVPHFRPMELEVIAEGVSVSNHTESTVPDTCTDPSPTEEPNHDECRHS